MIPNSFLRRVLLSVSLVVVAASVQAARPVAYSKVKVRGVWMNVVTADLGDPRITVTPAVSKRGIGTCESFRCMIRRTRPAAAINGTFFDVRTLKPTGDIVIDRQLVCKGDLGCAIAMTANTVSFLPSRRPDLYHWYNYDSVLAGGPTLIQNGKIVVVPRQEGFRSGVHFSRRKRAAVALTKANKLLLVTTTRPEYLSRLARAMVAMGCIEAAVMDGGSSVGLYCKGKLVVNPGRGMTNCLLIYDDRSQYENRRALLLPATSTAPAGS